jgi:hypothetical protein
LGLQHAEIESETLRGPYFGLTSSSWTLLSNCLEKTLVQKGNRSECLQ